MPNPKRRSPTQAKVRANNLASYVLYLLACVIIKVCSAFLLMVMTVEEFIKQNAEQIKSYPLALQALWHDYQDNWHQSHSLIDTAMDKDSAWVHAYLHRKEGDIGNARYWYRRSGKPESRLSLSQERQEIARVLIQEITN